MPPKRTSKPETQDGKSIGHPIASLTVGKPVLSQRGQGNPTVLTLRRPTRRRLAEIMDRLIKDLEIMPFRSRHRHRCRQFGQKNKGKKFGETNRGTCTILMILI